MKHTNFFDEVYEHQGDSWLDTFLDYAFPIVAGVAAAIIIGEWIIW